IGTAVLGGVSLTNGGTADMFIAKYDPLGTALWARQIGAHDVNYGNPFGLAVDNAGNCLISSRYQGVANLGTLSVSNGSAFLAKYDNAGTLVWALEGPEANAIAVGTNGAIYATGNGFLAKYDGQGSLVWSNAFPNGRAIALDGAQNLLVTGNGAPGSYGGFALTNTGGFTDLFVAKCDPSGAVLWLKQAGSVKQQAGLGIARDEFDNVYVTAASATKNADPALTFGAVTLSNVMSFVAKYDAAGNGLWAKALGTTNWAVGWGIGVAPTEQVYLCGSFQGTAVLGNFVLAEDPPSIGSAFVAKLDGSEPRPMLNLAKAGNQVQLDVTGGAGFRYAVQTSSNLLDWSGVTTNVAPFGFLDDGGVSARFYRAVFVP
ncbi:MAG TPA: hypothetical protein VN794_08900, partial [Methylomirabilota bacterium]|nr:hypothetical protein [Methylomirabilota bacterium]